MSESDGYIDVSNAVLVHPDHLADLRQGVAERDSALARCEALAAQVGQMYRTLHMAQKQMAAAGIDVDPILDLLVSVEGTLPATDGHGTGTGDGGQAG